MYLTVSVEWENVTGLGVVISNSRQEIWEALDPCWNSWENIPERTEFLGKNSTLACVTDSIKLKTSQRIYNSLSEKNL